MERQQIDLNTALRANSTSTITCVKDLLPFLLHVRVTYVHLKRQARLEGFITDGGYACACPASAGCGYHGKALSALQFEKYAGSKSSNQNGHILLPNGKSLHQLLHDLRDVPAEAFAAKFWEFAGVPMTVPAAEASPASSEPNGVQVHGGVTVESPWVPAPAALGDVEMLTEDDRERARLFLLDLSPTSSSRGSAAEEMAYSLGDYSNESAGSNSISNFNWGASKRRSGRQFRPQGDTETSTTTFSGNPDEGASGLSTGTSKKKKGTEETRSTQNTGGPLSLSIIDGVKSGSSPVPTAVIPSYSKHDSTYLRLISLSSPVTSSQQGPPPNCSIDSEYKELKMRDTTLHPLIFKEGGLPDNTLLTYKLKNGEVRRQGYKKGTVIICNCCNQEFTPSRFEKHAGMGERRQPHRWTGRYEAHLWDNTCRKEGQTRKGRQVYLGGYDREEKAARAYDLAAFKYWGPSTHINFPLSHYEKELEEMKHMSRQEFIAHLRRNSSGFSRGASMYRGITSTGDGRLGLGGTQEEAAEAYDIAAIKFRGLNEV